MKYLSLLLITASVCLARVEMPKAINPFENSSNDSNTTTTSKPTMEGRNTASGDAGGDHPCKKIKAACEAAGYKEGAWKEKKGLFVNCVKPIMEGQSVSEVAVSADDIAACQAKKAKHQNKK